MNFKNIVWFIKAIIIMIIIIMMMMMMIIIIVIITLFQLLKMYQFVKNKLVLIREQINTVYNIPGLHKNDNNR